MSVEQLEHQVLALSSVLVAIFFGVLWYAHVRAPEYKEAVQIVMPTRPTILKTIEYAATWLIVGGWQARASRSMTFRSAT